MAPLPRPGTFRLYPYANPPLPAGSYTLTGEVGGLPGAVDALQTAIDVTAPRYALPPDQVLSTFPPASARGAFTSRLPQIVLRRRTLPWERSEFAADGTVLDTLDEATRAATTPRPWLALVLIAEGEGSLFSDVPVGESVTSPVRLAGDADAVKATCLEVPESVVAKVFPALEDLPMLCHVREVDLLDTELAMGDDDGWMAVVLGNRLPQPNTRYTACLVNLEGQYGELPVTPPVAEEYSKTAPVVDLATLQTLVEASHSSGDAGGMGLPANLLTTELATGGPGVPLAGRTRRAAPAAGAAWASTPAGRVVTASEASLVYEPASDLRLIGTGVGVVVPWHLVARTLRFPVLASWSFQCTDSGDFQSLAQNVSSRLLGHVATGPEGPDGEPLPPGTVPAGLPAEPPSVRPLPLTSATGHVATAHETRRGETTTAWFRGPLVPEPVARAGSRPDGRYPLAHHADQLRRITPDGQEDLAYAAAFEIGRLLALSRPSVVAALNRWRQQGFAAVTAGAVAAQIAEAAPNLLRTLLEVPDPLLDGRVAIEGIPGPPMREDERRGAGAGRRFARGLLAALGDRPSDLAEARPLADPGFAVDAVAAFAQDRDVRLTAGLALGDALDGDPAGQAERLRAAPVTVAPRDPAADLAAARLGLEDAAGEIAAAAELLAHRLREEGPA
jgi:hypothetical protein